MADMIVPCPNCIHHDICKYESLYYSNLHDLKILSERIGNKLEDGGYSRSQFFISGLGCKNFFENIRTR